MSISGTALIFALLTSLFCGTAGAGDAPRAAEFLTEPFTLDRKYETMVGPRQETDISLLESEESELLWITGGRIEVLAEDGGAPVSDEFLCHSHINFSSSSHSPEQHNRLFANTTSIISKQILAWVQGQLAIEFPNGFAIPVLSSEPLSYEAYLLNVNSEGDNSQIRFKARVNFYRDRELPSPVKPLSQRFLFTLYPQDGRPSFHWMVPPGRHVYRYNVSEQMALPFDTTVHYISAHIHAFGQSIELRDLTTGESVFKSEATNYTDKIGIAHMDNYSSPDGIPIYKDHDYEVVSVYNNTTTSHHGAMGILRLYFWDKEFRYAASERPGVTIN